MLEELVDAGLVWGTTVGIDATTLEANAALLQHPPILRRDTAEDGTAFLTRLAASGIATPTSAELARFDRSRTTKTTSSNAEWTHPRDPDARVTKMKDGRTHLAHKAEQAVDLETGAVVGVAVQEADRGDTTTLGRYADRGTAGERRETPRCRPDRVPASGRPPRPGARKR